MEHLNDFDRKEDLQHDGPLETSFEHIPTMMGGDMGDKLLENIKLRALMLDDSDVIGEDSNDLNEISRSIGASPVQPESFIGHRLPLKQQP